MICTFTESGRQPTTTLWCHCSVLSAETDKFQAQLADVEALRIAPLRESLGALTADIAARDESIAAQQAIAAGLQAQITQLEAALETKRSKKRAYKTAFAGKVGSGSDNKN